MYEHELVLNNQQKLICRKTQKTTIYLSLDISKDQSMK